MPQHINTPIPTILEPTDELEETENLIEHSSSAAETCLVLTCPQINVNSECIGIAPGEGKLPKSILNDKYCEELSFPKLFPTRKFGYKVWRKIPFSPLKYFNQRLFNYSQKFASDTDYTFLARIVCTIVATPLNSNLSDAKKKKKEILTEMYNILKTVPDYINEYLNLSKYNFYDVQ